MRAALTLALHAALGATLAAAVPVRPVAALAGPVAALAGPVAWDGPPRAGFTIGVGAGLGEMSLECPPDGCTGALDHSATLAVHAGGMLCPRQALLYDGWLLVHRSGTSFGDATTFISIHTLAFQGWPLPRLWLRGGAGLAHLSMQIGDLGRRDDIQPALSGAVGFEALHRSEFAVDVALRAGVAFFDEEVGQDEPVYNVALSGGVSWY